MPEPLRCVECDAELPNMDHLAREYPYQRPPRLCGDCLVKLFGPVMVETRFESIHLTPREENPDADPA